ncbi:PREDICTED: uncharacterized protein LOC107881891 [Prunus mume]|uniref:Uncharacterized protein LOC107881891 n=1 Tax=Prunus mume TaxID=102107 RepID=A0ABM1LYC4_PRUMU|nr:PREDICTED: uncharacterized protein LOC107881891 [Prunus mume]
MDLIGKIYPTSSKQHCFTIVATDYFTKWVEAKPVKSTTSQEIITFIDEQIIQWFGIPESITTDRGSSFISGEMLNMAEAFKFKLLQSTLRTMLKLIDRQNQQSNSQNCSSTQLIGEDYSQAMLLELEGLDGSRLYTLNKLFAGKQAVSRAYNKRVKNESFEEGEIVWKVVLPLRTHIAGYGKWSPTWEGPFIIKQILRLGAYRLQDRDGDVHAAPINGKWLKKFYSTMWDSQAMQTNPGIKRQQNEAVV